MWSDIQRKAVFAKPCPYCGSRNIITERKEAFYKADAKTCTYMECDDCGATVYGVPVRDEKTWKFSENYNIAQHEALKRWNRRAS